MVSSLCFHFHERRVVIFVRPIFVSGVSPRFIFKLPTQWPMILYHTANIHQLKSGDHSIPASLPDGQGCALFPHCLPIPRLI